MRGSGARRAVTKGMSRRHLALLLLSAASLSPAAIASAESDACDKAAITVDCGDSDFAVPAPTKSDIVEEYYDATVDPAVYGALGDALAKPVGSSFTTGDLGPFTKPAVVKVRLMGKGFVAGTGTVKLGAGKKAPLKVTFTAKGKSALAKKGKLKVNALLDLTDKASKAAYGDERSFTVKG